jgi:hypothetical protein
LSRFDARDEALLKGFLDLVDHFLPAARKRNLFPDAQICKVGLENLNVNYLVVSNYYLLYRQA